jgi:hypothetical protein
VREFKDEEGRPWRLALTVAAAMRVKDAVIVQIDGEAKPFDLVDVAAIGTTMQVLRGQYTVIAETLYAILCRQCDEKKLSKDDFFDGLRGDSLDAAAKALEAELIDFFPQRLRKMVSLIAAKIDEATAELLAKAETSIEQAKMGDIIPASGQPSGSVQESSASTQESGHSDSLSPPAMLA